MFFLSFMSAMTAATGTMSAAGFGIGTADALGAAFLCLININRRAAKNSQDNCHNQKIDHILFLSAGGQFCLQFLVRIDAQEDHDGCHDHYCQQAAQETCAKAAGGNQSANLVDQEAQSVAYTQLQQNAAEEPLFVLDLCIHCADGCKAGRSE